jgi:hypothetical protein
MMTPNMRLQCRVLVHGLLVFIGIFGLFAFSRAAEDKLSQAECIRRDVEQQALEEAVQAFNASDYKKARIDFEMLSESAKTPEIGRQALYGLASVKLALARSSDEYEDAISSWKKWNAQAGPCTIFEDPRMVTPFLLHIQTSIKSGLAGSRSARGRKPKEVDFRGMLQTKEREMQVLRSKLEMRDREIHRLRHQLESLEEIHRKYEEKKQGSSQ